MERLNRDMTERFLEHQRRSQASLQHWELERQRQHDQALERWRQEAREHERAMFGLFARMVSECNAAVAAVAKEAAKYHSGGARAAEASRQVEEEGPHDEGERSVQAEENGVKEEEVEEEEEEVQEDEASL